MIAKLRRRTTASARDKALPEAEEGAVLELVVIAPACQPPVPSIALVGHQQQHTD